MAVSGEPCSTGSQTSRGAPSIKKDSPPVTASLGFGILSRPKPVKRRTDEPSAPPLRRPRILVVDSELALRRLTCTRLTLANYAVDAVDTAEAALDACVRSRPNLVITDLHLQPMDGLSLLKELKSRWPALTVIILTSHGTIRQAVAATQCGAFGFLVKPVEKDELLGQVRRAVEVSTFTRVEGNWRADIVSRSQLMEDRLGLANKAAASDEPVLLTGENGTGKELLARAIHAASPRRDKPFLTVTCRGASVAALEEDLFGAGASQAVAGGTLLLHEIGDLPDALQVRLSLALQRGEIGGEARLICTTSRDLKAQMDANGFRRELYYRISVLPIEIPPLGRRREDIPLLVSHFLEQASEPGTRRKIYSPKAIELLATTDWPGNVRQLFDLVKQNVALSSGKVITEEMVQASLGTTVKPPTYEEAREKFSREYLADNLSKTSGNVTESARLAKRNRTDFYKLLARYRIQPDDFKVTAPQK